MNLVMICCFDSQESYRDPHTMKWKVVTKRQKDTLQIGKIRYQPVAAYGPHDDLQKYPPVTERDVNAEAINQECKNNTHMRSFFWETYRYWKKKDPKILLCVRGGWENWSHFLHRTIHDFPQERREENFGKVIDLDCVEFCQKEKLTWLTE